MLEAQKWIYTDFEKICWNFILIQAAVYLFGQVKNVQESKAWPAESTSDAMKWAMDERFEVTR